jgi:branched-chain amino acid transport system substrate-binding protein
MKMSKILRFVVSIVMVAIAVYTFSACTTAKSEITIGAIFPLTGEAGQYGQDAKAGIDLALEEHNVTKPSEVIKILFEDDQANPTTSISAFRKLVNVDKVKIILGPMSSSSALAVAPIAEQAKVVLLSPSASAAKLTKPNDFFFRNELSDMKGAEIQAEEAFSQLNIKKISILYVNNEYGVGVKDGFSKAFRSVGGNVLMGESFEANSKDFRTQLTKIKQVDSDALFIVAQKETVSILRQMKEMKLKTKILSTPLFEDPTILKQAKTESEGAIYIYYGTFDLKGKNQRSQGFISSFSKKYSREPSYYSALAYDAANIIFSIASKNASDTQAIADEIIKIRNFPGITGDTSFDLNGDVSKPISFKTVKNGAFSPLNSSQN